jgi:glycosyltransferase involved in cell wall biosynthesis
MHLASPTKTPFFSLVIPTKNRANLLRHALESLREQTFSEFEIIVADNDDTDATAQVIREFPDCRLMHVRTGNLSMPDNWEAGFVRASGEYICMLEDKQALKRRSLERLFKAVEAHKPLVVKWQYDAFDDSDTPFRLRLAKGTSAEPRIISSDELLNRFCSEFNGNYKSILPLPQLGAFHQKLARRIKKGVMGRLFHPVSPDVILGLLALNYADEILDLPAALGVYSSTTHSNGASSAVRGVLFQTFLRELGFNEDRLYDLVPLKTINIPGSIFNDYMHLQERVGGRLARHAICWTKFFYDSQEAIWQSAWRDIDVSEQQQAWETALASQANEVKSSVREALSKLSPPAGPSSSLFRRMGKRIGFPWVERQVKATVRGRLLRGVEWRFSSVTDYLKWEVRQTD